MIRTSDSTKFLVAALAEFHKSEVSVPKSATNPFFKSKYADLWTIKAACDPVLTSLGLVVIQFPGQSEVGAPTLFMPKDTPQDQGSAITYMRRYAYSAILGIVADPDDDGERAMQRSRVSSKAGQEKAQGEIPGTYTEEIRRESPPPSENDAATSKQVGYLKRLLDDAGVAPSEWSGIVNKECPPWPDSLSNLSKRQCSVLIDLYKT
jgi:hypothetical protein